MGGLEGGRRDGTTEVLLEAANFEPLGASRRRSARPATEGSNRWEQGVDPGPRRARRRAREQAHRRPAGGELAGERRRHAASRRDPGGSAAGAQRHGSSGSSRAGRAARDPRATRLRGRATSWDVTVPTLRARDVTREIDLVEEVIRVGLERVPRHAATSGDVRASDADAAGSPQSPGHARRAWLLARPTRGAFSARARTGRRSGCRSRSDGEQAVLRTSLLDGPRRGSARGTSTPATPPSRSSSWRKSTSLGGAAAGGALAGRRDREGGYERRGAPSKSCTRR